MKIGTPELKTKPATKYFEHGYISFSTRNKELSYEIFFYATKSFLATLEKGKVKDQEHLNKLLNGKTLREVQTLC